MAIPTQFSVTSTRTSPIANPRLPKDLPAVLAPEDANITDGADILSSLSSSVIPLPISATAESKSGISTPDTAFARGKSSISAPDSASANNKVLIDAPSSATAESASSVSIPASATASNAANIDTPTSATAESASNVNIPVNATAESATGIDTPTSATAENSTGVQVPVSKTALPQTSVSAPSEKTALAKATTSIPSSATAEDKQGVSIPSSAAAESAATVNIPAVATGEDKASINTPSAIPAQKSGTNLLTYSEQFDNSAWIKSRSSVTANQTIAPDGTLTADAMFDSTDTNYHSTFQFKDVTAGETYTLSFYAKSGTLTQAGAQFGGAQFGACECLIDLIKGSVLVETGCTVSVRRAGEWYRVSTTATATATGISAFGIISGKDGNVSYAGTGTDFFYVWGAQLEDSLTANDYKKTEATPITAEIQSPSVASSESSVVVATPSSLTANPRTATTPPFPLNHARILANNILKNYSTLTATNEAAGFPVTNALTANTGQTWRFTTAASTMQLDFGGGTEQIDMLCIGGHNLGRAGATVEVYYEPEPGGTLVQFGGTKNLNATQNDALCFYSETILEALSIEVRITGASGVPQISYISGGVALQMQRPFFNGHVPITDADVTEFYNPRTESGNIRSRLIRRQGYKTSYDFNNIDDTWYRTYFEPVKELLKTEVIFTAWNLLEYPDDIGFGLVEGDINTSMQNGFGTKRNGLSFTLLGY